MNSNGQDAPERPECIDQPANEPRCSRKRLWGCRAYIEHLEADNRKWKGIAHSARVEKDRQEARIEHLEEVIEARDEQIRSLGGHI